MRFFGSIILIFFLSYHFCDINNKVYLTCNRLNKTQLFYLEDTLMKSVEITDFESFSQLVDVCEQHPFTILKTFIPSKPTIVDELPRNLSRLINGIVIPFST